MVVDLTKWRTGFCDRLVQVTFCITVARLRGDLKLYFKAKQTRDCPYDFLDICFVRGFEVLPWNPSLAELSEWRMDYHKVTPNHIQKAVCPDLDAVRRHKPKDIGISDGDFLEQWFASYTLLEPKPEIALKVLSLGVGHSTLGIHIRRTDKIENGRSRFTGYNLEESELELRTNQHVVKNVQQYGQSAFLACDNEDSKRQWTSILQQHGISVISNAARFDKTAFRQTSGEDFMVDLFGLAQCGHIVGTGESNVIRAAAYIGGQMSWSLALPV